MSGAGFILAINMTVAGLLAAVFLAIAAYDRARTAPRWLAASYALGMAYFALEVAIPLSGSHPAATFGSYAAFLLALATLNVALGRMYDVAIPWRTMALLILGALALRIAIDDMARASVARQLLYQLPYFTIQMVGVWLVARSASKGLAEHLLLALLAASGLHYLAKPFIAMLTGGVGAAVGKSMFTGECGGAAGSGASAWAASAGLFAAAGFSPQLAAKRVTRAS